VPAVAAPVNPNLSANLNADYVALENDMQQARELAADFQRQLAGKSNEFAQLKQLFEKSLVDLAHLQTGIVELRAERHRLANEAMRGTAFQLKLNKVTSERDRLRVDLEFVREALARSGEEIARALRDRDTQIAGLVIEVVTLKEALAQAQRRAGNAQVFKAASDDAVREKRLPDIDPDGAKTESDEAFIDISFSR
jgi:chromosome segregation ATPase